nr:immunoglobulin light chain junction region [Macaca mulatta]MOV62454.1 immunoglobulin light chain junction region [Macaca mulatta]MOV62690.1 immunoglobulin light chain junction region [Macaca mulatta]MOV63079.1 immunoglobulin light chain junction region [Macaca mulatta]MOV63296.1 immunoglobulin light chain junction region [Macaca mulatta]
CQQHNSYPLIF